MIWIGVASLGSILAISTFPCRLFNCNKTTILLLKAIYIITPGITGPFPLSTKSSTLSLTPFNLNTTK